MNERIQILFIIRFAPDGEGSAVKKKIEEKLEQIGRPRRYAMSRESCTTLQRN